jgi:hypothetical protein
MINPFRGNRDFTPGSPRDYIPVTPSDTVDLQDSDGKTVVVIGLFIETGGVLVVETEAKQDRTVNVPDNFYFIGGVRKVRSTNTTASGIHALPF